MAETQSKQITRRTDRTLQRPVPRARIVHAEDARAEEYFLIEAEVNPNGADLDVPHAHSFLVHWATNTVRDLSNGLDRSCALTEYYWLGRIVPAEPKHFAYTLHEMFDALKKYQRFGPGDPGEIV